MTAPVVQLKRSDIAGKVPLPADLSEGEIALNTKDGVIYFKTPEGTIGSITNASGGTALVEQIAIEKAIVMAIALG